MHRRRLLLATAGALALTALRAHAQPAFPTKALRIVVPFAAGGVGDLTARAVATGLAERLGQPVVIDNRPGANGLLGAENVLGAPADGYRLLFTYTAAMVVNPVLLKKPPFDPLKDFAPVAQIGRGGNIMMVRKDLPVSNLKEFVDYAKARPGKLNYCSWGAGSGGHLTMEVLMKQAGLTMTHVPYKGSMPCNQDLVGGQVDANWSDVSTSIALVQAGRVKALASSTPTRLPQLPDVPTLNEAGYPFTTYSWYVVFAPGKTPPAIVAKLNEAIQTALKDPVVAKRMLELNFTDLPLATPEQFKATVAKDLQDWTALIKSIGLTLD